MDKNKLNEIIESIKEIKMLESQLHQESVQDISRHDEIQADLERLERITSELCSLFIGFAEGPWKVSHDPIKQFMTDLISRNKK